MRRESFITIYSGKNITLEGLINISVYILVTYISALKIDFSFMCNFKFNNIARIN